MKNDFNLKKYLVCILVLFIGNFSKHEEEVQPHQDDARKNTLAAECWCCDIDSRPSQAAGLKT